MRKTKRTPDDFVSFLQERLIPDYRESDPDSATADTLAEACAHILALQRSVRAWQLSANEWMAMATVKGRPKKRYPNGRVLKAWGECRCGKELPPVAASAIPYEFCSVECRDAASAARIVGFGRGRRPKEYATADQLKAR